MNTYTHTDDLPLLIATLPAPLQQAVHAQHDNSALLEVVLDVGRLPQARYPDHVVALAQTVVMPQDLQHVIAAVGSFGADNRAGIEGTLHRISALRNRRGDIVGLTLRVGRAVFGTIDLIRDLVQSGRNVLLLGRPGVGKTTKLREVARVLADDLHKRVVIVDTSNEIGGDGDVPHAAIGGARRMQVAHPDQQHATMIEAVENHMPEVIIVDEIGTLQEALAARTIAERGVQLIGTAHGNTLRNIVMNPTLCDLVGGIQTVILGDDEARFRGTQKTVLERKAPPTFDAVVEIVGREEVVVHADTARAVDRLLQGQEPGGLRRTPERETAIGTQDAVRAPPEPPRAPDRPGHRATRIFPYALSPDSVERVIRDLGVAARTVARPEQADMIVALRARGEDQRLQRIVRATGVPVHAVKKNSTAQIRHALRDVFHVVPGMEDIEVQEAVREAEDAIQRVIADGIEVPLSPRRPALRKVQHRIVARHHLDARSEGREPRRHLVVVPATA